MTDTASRNKTHPKTPTPPPLGPLSGITILDLTRVLAGPYCTMILYDLGARIIKVEPPGGDDSRGYGPWFDGESAYFMSLNRGKESILLNLKDSDDRLVFEKLVADADVLVENFRPGTMKKLGYGWDTLHIQYPKLIYAACSGFGQTGPYSQRPGFGTVVEAMSGFADRNGFPDREPVLPPLALADMVAGLYGAMAVLIAIREREVKGGEGQVIDLSLLEPVFSILGADAAGERHLGEGDEQATVRDVVAGADPPGGNNHNDQMVGVRFAGSDIPAGATITNAFIPYRLQ